MLLFDFLSATMRLKGLTSAIYTFRLVLALELHPHQAYPHRVLILPVLLSGSEAYPSTLNIICYGIVMHLYYCFQLAIKKEHVTSRFNTYRSTTNTFRFIDLLTVSRSSRRLQVYSFWVPRTASRSNCWQITTIS